RGNFEKSEWCWQQSLRLDPHFPDVHANLARVAWRRGQTQRATQLFLRQLRETPGDIDTLLDLGRLLAELGRHAESGEKFRRVLEINPSDAGAHHHLGELSLLAGHLDAASAELNQAIRLEPDRPGLHLALAQVAHRRGQFESARTHVAAELELPRHTPAQTLAIAQLLIELRLPQPAVDLLTPLLEAAPKREPAGEHDDESAIRPAAPALSRSATGWLYRGVARMLQNRFDEGIADCRRAYRLDPRYLLATQNLALASLTKGRLTAAAVWIRRARSIRPDDPQIRLLAARLWRANVRAAIVRLLHRK
ncbi:MAG: tetratricopeptide repeat protein, partial [Planctomycetota bacterium]|nr:tetratricopeptide repeat protein [Planctomycetota bacterium]